MTRRSVINRGVVCLALGLVTTVVVAAWFGNPGPGVRPARSVWWSPPVVPLEVEHAWLPSADDGAIVAARVVTGRSAGRIHRSFLFFREEGVRSSLPAFRREWKSWGVSVAALDRIAARRPAARGSLTEHAFGWPMPAVWVAPDPSDPASLGWGVELPFTRLDAFRPRPVWWGLLIDSIVFGILWWMVLAAARWVAWFFAWRPKRSERRRARGWCPMCGYDLGGNLGAGCPECGWGKGG